MGEAKTSWMLTRNGKAFDFADPQPSDICIEDIAYALSRQCRYTGHTKFHYSVAQHCVLIAKLLPRHLAFQGLMHDATEAYLADICAPAKKFLPDYNSLEQKIWEAVCLKFNIDVYLHPVVKEYDLRITEDERLVLLPETPDNLHFFGGHDVQPLGVSIKPWSTHTAKKMFIMYFERLKP